MLRLLSAAGCPAGLVHMGREPGGSERLTTTQLFLTNAVAALEDQSRSYSQEPVFSGSILILSPCELNQLKELLVCALMCHLSCVGA